MGEIDFERMPNFLVIGASKCGTTTLYDIAKQHPDVYVSKKKELDFFSYQFDKGVTWYQDTYFENASGYPARGEVSPSYQGQAYETARHIDETYQGRPVKLISIFRNPVDRAYSAYWFWVKYTWENLPFEDAIRTEREWFKAHPEARSFPPRHRSYLYCGMYAKLLKPYLERLPRENFLFLLTEELETDFKGTARKLYEFLGVDPIFEPEAVVKNPAMRVRNRRLQKSLLNPADPLRRAARTAAQIFPSALRERWKQKLARANLKQEKYPPMKAATRQELAAEYVADIEELEGIMGRDLSHWKVA